MAVIEPRPGGAPAAGGEHMDTFGIPPDVYHRRWIILGVLTLSLVMVVTSVSSLNVALPSIRDALDASGTELQWMVDAYALVFAGLLLSAGALGDRFGRKGALQVGLVIYGAAALLASEAGTPAQLIAMRAVLGIGAALIMPATLSIIVSSFPMHERPKAIAIWAGFAGVGGALGPISSGLLLEHYWWGSVFFVNVILAVALLALSSLLVPTSKDPTHTALDPVGATLSVVGLVALVYAVIEGPVYGWSDPLTVGGFALAAVALAAFIRFELASRNPMLDPRLFKVPAFSAGSAAVTLAFFSMFGMFFLLTQYLQYVKGYTPLQTGLRVIPNALMMMLLAPQGPRLVGRFGVKRVMRAGFVLTGAGFTLLATGTEATPYWLLAFALMCTGSGMAAMMPPASQLIVGSLPLSKAGVASAVNDVTREVGGALGIAVAGSVVATVYRNHSAFTEGIADPAAAEVARDSIGQAIAVGRDALERGVITNDQFLALRDAAGSAFTDGTHWAFGILAAVSLVGSIVVPRFVPDALPTRAVPN